MLYVGATFPMICVKSLSRVCSLRTTAGFVVGLCSVLGLYEPSSRYGKEIGGSSPMAW